MGKPGRFKLWYGRRWWGHARMETGCMRCWTAMPPKGKRAIPPWEMCWKGAAGWLIMWYVMRWRAK